MGKAIRWDYQAGAWLMKCSVCQREFHAKRLDADACSARCRKYKSRADDRKNTALHTLQHASYSVRRVATSYSNSQDVYDQMVVLKQAVEASLKLFNVTWEQQPLTPAPSPAAKARRVTMQQKKRYGEVVMPAPAAPEVADA